MNVIFLEEAEQELLEAVLYYDKQAQGLGKKFASECKKFKNLNIEFYMSK